MIELTRSDWSQKQKFTFGAYAERLGAKVDDSWKYDEWCQRAREVGRELRVSGRQEERL